MKKDAPINLNKKGPKYLFRSRFKPKVGKDTYTGTKKEN